jgi:cyclopropane fatty-acyl-phospholipid synthase-like methyltransferase
MKIGGYELKVPYVTTAADSMKAILELASPTESDRIVDLGSGNGRVLLEFAKYGLRVSGYEIRPELVDLARQKVKELGFEGKVQVFHESFWDIDLSPFSIIYVYGMTTIMGRLESKLQKECKPGTKVLSNIFTFPHWKVKKTKDHINLYIVI